MLAAGSTLGPYKILAPLRAGGMGGVCRAHDTRLGRDLAIKALPPHLAASPEVRARFEREARTISQLNHPHIHASRRFLDSRGTPIVPAKGGAS